MAYTFDLAAWKTVPFADAHEIHEAQRNPLYQDSEAYRQAFATKLGISGDIGPQAHVGNNPNRIYVATPGSNNLHETGLTPEEIASSFSPATKEELQQYADLHADDPLALDPSLMIQPRARKPAPTTEPSISTEEGQIARFGKTFKQIISEKNESEAAAPESKDKRVQSLREERNRLVEERERVEAALWNETGQL